jgi:tRNA pseudouridine13 synthase
LPLPPDPDPHASEREEPRSEGSAALGFEPEDFRVVEIPLYPPLGEGTHTFVELEKRLLTTEEVVRVLARAAGVRPSEIGYAGRKDRNAVTRQWFSVPGWPPSEAARLALPGLRVLGAELHPHKLRTGQLRGNRFELRLRGLDDSARLPLERALAEITTEGMPNRFGAQRFGRDSDNSERGREVLLGLRSARGRQARFLVSSLQAAVFNEVLVRRPLPLSRLEAGDVAVRHVSGGLFSVEDPAKEQPRADAFEISPTGPIPGTRTPLAEGEPGRREREALRSLGLEEDAFSKPPRGLRLRGARRALRVAPDDGRIDGSVGDLVLHFSLPAGSYATVLVEELALRSGRAIPWPGAPPAPRSSDDSH